jgi:hypothetical protein
VAKDDDDYYKEIPRRVEPAPGPMRFTYRGRNVFEDALKLAAVELGETRKLRVRHSDIEAILRRDARARVLMRQVEQAKNPSSYFGEVRGWAHEYLEPRIAALKAVEEAEAAAAEAAAEAAEAAEEEAQRKAQEEATPSEPTQETAPVRAAEKPKPTPESTPKPEPASEEEAGETDEAEDEVEAAEAAEAVEAAEAAEAVEADEAEDEPYAGSGAELFKRLGPLTAPEGMPKQQQAVGFLRLLYPETGGWPPKGRRANLEALSRKIATDSELKKKLGGKEPPPVSADTLGRLLRRRKN